jgi:hypothetical protein
MPTALAIYGANLALIALNAAKAAGDSLLVQLGSGVAADVPAFTTTAVADFVDVVPESYRPLVLALATPAESSIDTTLADKIHTGIAIAQAALDNRISALEATLTAGAGVVPAATTAPAAAGGTIAPAAT